MARQFRHCKLVSRSVAALICISVAQIAVDGKQSGISTNTCKLVMITNSDYMRENEGMSMSDVFNKMIASSSSPSGPYSAKQNRDEDNISLQRVLDDKIIKRTCGGQQRDSLDQLFSRVFHETATPFS